MQTRLMSGTTEAILELVQSVSSAQEALDILSGSYEHNAERVLLRADQLPADFYDLQTRFAGEFVQKLVNHRLRIAAVFGEDMVLGERFREYVAEARRGKHFRTFENEADAIVWLEGQ